MIKSMTGYGKAEHSLKHEKITVEMRSVNHRYGEVSVKLPRALLCFEHEIRKAVSERLKRGKIDIFIQVDSLADGRPLAVNIPLAKAYYSAFNMLREELAISDPVPLPMIVSQKDVLTVAEGHDQAEGTREALLSVVGAAVDMLETMRSSEGRELADDLRKRRGYLDILLDRISARAPAVPVEYAEKLSARLAQFASGNIPDEVRVSQEIALMADRCDITEELVRFSSHLTQFDSAFDAEDPIGRKLDFIIQEMGREVNTIGSKANDSTISTCVVELKAELEKIREQVQNIE